MNRNMSSENIQHSSHQDSLDSPELNTDIFQRIDSVLDHTRKSFLDEAAATPQSPIGFGRRQFRTSTPMSAFIPHKPQEDMPVASPLRQFHQKSHDTGYCSEPNSPMLPRKQLFAKHSDSLYSSLRDSPFTESTHSLPRAESNTSRNFVNDEISDCMKSLSLGNKYLSTFGGSNADLLNPSAVNQWEQEALKLHHRLSALKQQQSTGLNRSLPDICRNQPGPGGDWIESSLEKAAKFHRSAAAVSDNALYTWSGQLPARKEKNAIYSCKVFLGGLPWDLNEQAIEQIFRRFGRVRVDWPGKEEQEPQPKGFVYLIFDSEKQVKALLSSCCKDYSDEGSWFFEVSSRHMRCKKVEVKPWNISDSEHLTLNSSQLLDPQKTVFVGALHGRMTAEALAKIMDELFGGVVYAGIDTDKYKYPIGSARITFNNSRSYMKAVAAAFIEIRTSKFRKKIQVDPYLEDVVCSACKVRQGSYFCREMICFRYFCRNCWHWHHTLVDGMKSHKHLMKKPKKMSLSRF